MLRDPLIVFDLDGLLIDSVDPCQALFYSIFEQDLGLRHKPEFGRETMSLTRERILDLEWGNEILKRQIPRERLQLTLKRYRQEKMKLYLPLLPHVKDFLKTLDPLFPELAVASNNPRVVIESILNRLGISNFFDGIIAMEDVTLHKPDPAIYLKAASVFGRNPDVCLVFEDSKSGVLSAKKAGMKVIAVTTGTDSEETLRTACPDLIVPHLGAVSASLVREMLAAS